jgi:hypothetical protein
MSLSLWHSFLQGVGAFWHQNHDFIFSAVTALATIFIAGFTCTLWRATDALNTSTTRLWKTANRQLEIEQRPWLSVVATFSNGLTWKDGIPRLTVDLTVKNHGKSPAIDFWIEQQMLYRVMTDNKYRTI